MRLRYFESKNFGDALNPYIFSALLPGFFNDDPEIDFFGIGSILGFDMVSKAKRKVVFSSGFAYGTKPQVDESYDIYCVRGPLTAQSLSLSPELGIIDGAVLLRKLPMKSPKKEFQYSFMPHWESELKYDWKSLCEKSGIHYISPLQDYLLTINEIQKTNVMLAEAMHAAIVADALRVPWIPIKAYTGINDFKWKDWTVSVDMHYQPEKLPSLFQDTAFVRDLCGKKISKHIPSSFYGAGLKMYEIGQSILEYNTLSLLEKVKKNESYLSNERLLDEKIELLMDKLDRIKKKYG
ncbi:MAG: hypothetical protein JNM57_01060 [Cyclobacteriaceae bacterium]|nr:hypothetical protein [Cyclobacteriaceae bacterium]